MGKVGRINFYRMRRRILRQYKAFFVDILAYISFWSGLSYFIEVVIFRMPISMFVATSAAGFVCTLILSGIYGRYLNFFRRLFGVRE